MRPSTLSQTGMGASGVFVPDVNANPFNIGLGAVISGTVTYSVQHTFDDIFASAFDPATATWFEHPTITAKTANTDGNYAYPVRGIRLNVTAGTGSVTLTIVQAG